MNTPEHTKNPNAVALGRLGGKPKGGRGRTLSRQEAQRISYLRWHPNNDEHQEDYKLAAQAIRDADRMKASPTTPQNTNEKENK